MDSFVIIGSLYVKILAMRGHKIQVRLAHPVFRAILKYLYKMTIDKNDGFTKMLI